MFGSDTQSRAHPSLVEAVCAANTGQAASYGDDDHTGAATKALSDVFETQVDIYPCISGTAANALALSAMCSPVGSVLCHHEAHIERDERGAVEHLSGGAKLQLLPGDDAKIDTPALKAALAARNPDFVHETPAEVLSLTNLTECGTAYAPDEIRARTEPARASGLRVHMDGARFANALCSPHNTAQTGKSIHPADLTWRAGVDILTFGITKNGGLGCDVIIAFNPAPHWRAHLAARAKRAGHMPAKMRYLSAQITASIQDDLWLTLARQANTAAQHLAQRLLTRPGASLAHPVHGNEVFIRLTDKDQAALAQAGIAFYPWPGNCLRFVCSWDTTTADIDTALAALTTPRSPT